MITETFDTLAYVRKLENVGFTREQAEAQANAIREIIDKRTVSREYLDITIKELELRLKYDLTIRLGGIVVVCTLILLALLPIILK